MADDAATIARQNLEIAKLKRQIYGPRSERTARLLDQMELNLEDLEATATEDELAAEKAAAKTTTVSAFTRNRPSRQPFPEHLPRERVVVPGPVACACCGGTRLRKLGETVTETLEVVPRQWKVIQHVREKMTCRDCERISEPPAPFHVTPRGWAGPNLLAMLLFEKFGQHQPLNRQAERYGREGVPFSLSTLADQVGAGCAVLEPLLRRVEAHVLMPSDCTATIRRCPCSLKVTPIPGDAGRSSSISNPGCRPSGPSFRAAAISQRPWITCSSAGRALRASSTMAAFACRTMPPNADCAASLWEGSRGCSPVPIAAVNAPPPCTA
jgi:transposase